MDKIDRKIRRFLVEEGYLFPVTDEEIEIAQRQLEASGFQVPPELDRRVLEACLKQKPPKRFVPTAKPQGYILRSFGWLIRSIASLTSL